MKRKNIFAAVLAFAVLLGLMTGCGASSDAAADIYISNGATAESAPEAPREDMDYGYAADTTDKPASGNVPEEGQDGFSNAKLIYTANIEMESTEFDLAVAGLEELVESMGGYFEESYVNNYGSYRSGNYTVRVPAENFEGFCSAVGQLCQLNAVSRSAKDISEAYYDTESRLVTQQTKLERLQTLLAQAESMEDIITLESAISDTELYIEQLTGTLRKYDSLVGFSTVTIYLQEVYKLTEVEEPVIGFGAKLAQAFKTGCSNFVDGLERGALRFARNWTDWLIFAIVVVVIILVARRVLKKLRVRRAARYAPVEKEQDNK